MQYFTACSAGVLSPPKFAAYAVNVVDYPEAMRLGEGAFLVFGDDTPLHQYPNDLLEGIGYAGLSTELGFQRLMYLASRAPGLFIGYSSPQECLRVLALLRVARCLLAREGHNLIFSEM